MGSGILCEYERGTVGRVKEWAAAMNYDDHLDECKNFCKHLCEGKGHPGEYVYFCHAPEHSHILHVDFNESEII